MQIKEQDTKIGTRTLLTLPTLGTFLTWMNVILYLNGREHTALVVRAPSMSMTRDLAFHLDLSLRPQNASNRVKAANITASAKSIIEAQLPLTNNELLNHRRLWHPGGRC